MRYDDILHSKFSGPAKVFSYEGGKVRTLDINSHFLPEMGMNIDEKEYIDADPLSTLDEINLEVYLGAVKKCVSSGEESECEIWASLMSNCCGVDKICLRVRLILLEKAEDHALIFEGIRNITPDRRHLDMLTDAERRYKMASEQINIYNWEYTIATKEMRPCYRCMRDLGLPALVRNYPEPAIDMGIFPPDYADMYRDMMQQIDNGIPEIEADIPLTVGRVPFRVRYTTEFDEAGNPVKAFGSATLISETELGRIRLDNQIIASLAEEFDCIYLQDFVKDSLKITKQDSVLRLPEGSTYHDLAEIIVPRLVKEHRAEAERLREIPYLRTKLFADADKREYIYRDADTGRWIRVDYHVVERDNDRQVTRVLITVSVIDDLRSQKMDADRLIARQKAELEERQVMLQKAVEEATKANAAKTVFFSNMSHDIRTPMGAITGFSKLALEDIDNKERVAEYLDKIITAGDHLLSLINDILDMSRIESGKMELSKEPSKVRDLCNDCADMIRDKMEEKKLRFETDLEALGDDTIYCDKLRFRQILLNLLSNAYKFTPDGGTVSLKGKLLSAGDRLTYEIRVKDTGIGMSKEFSEQIWDSFTREEVKAVHETQGTGLGMSIVKNIVNLMQGTVSLETAPGKGSEFTVTLPLEPCDAAAEASKQEKVAAADAMNRRYDGRTILVVDDTPMNLKLAEHTLTKFGFTVRQTSSGIDAIELVKRSAPGEIDLILMDVSMPVMSGLEATRRIRALEDPALRSIPILAMTANAFASDIQDALDAGMNAHVPKPFLKEDLITKINANLH